MGRHSMASTRSGYAAATAGEERARAGRRVGARKTNFDGGRHGGESTLLRRGLARRPRETTVRSAGWHRLGAVWATTLPLAALASSYALGRWRWKGDAHVVIDVA